MGINCEYKVLSYRGLAILERWLCEMSQQWYDIEYVYSDNWSTVVIYRRLYIAQDSEEETTEEVEEPTEE